MTNIPENPRIAMEEAVLAEQYMGVKSHLGAELVFWSQRKCRTINEKFGLLWHNSELGAKELRYFFSEVV